MILTEVLLHGEANEGCLWNLDKERHHSRNKIIPTPQNFGDPSFSVEDEDFPHVVSGRYNVLVPVTYEGQSIPIRKGTVVSNMFRQGLPWMVWRIIEGNHTTVLVC